MNTICLVINVDSKSGRWCAWMIGLCSSYAPTMTVTQYMILGTMTNKELEALKKYVRKWLNKFGLQSYDVHVRFGDVGNDKAVAEVSFDVTERTGFIVMDESVEGDICDKNLEAIAIHETLELLLGGMRDLIESLYNSDVADQEIHIVIRTLEKLFRK